MPILEARFHFFAGDDAPVVVGHIIWPEEVPVGRPTIRTAFMAGRPNPPPQLIAELRDLVKYSGPDPFHALQALRMACWSFVDVTPRDGKPPDLVRTVKRLPQRAPARCRIVVVP